MHFLQNDWFITNWLWVIQILVMSIGLVAYINNRPLLIKKAIFSFASIFIIILSFSYYSPDFVSLNSNEMNLKEITNQNLNSVTPSVYTKILSFVSEIFFDKVNN